MFISLITNIQIIIVSKYCVLTHLISHFCHQSIAGALNFSKFCKIYFLITNLGLLSLNVTPFIINVLLMLIPDAWKQSFVTLRYLSCGLKTKQEDLNFFTLKGTVIKAILTVP